MRLKLRGRADEPVQTPAEGFELPDFAWPLLPSEDLPPPPSAPAPARPRRPRRPPRRPVLWVALALAGAGGVLLLVLERCGDKPLSQREKAQLEAAQPGSSKAGRKASLSVPPVVKRTAARLPLPRAVAQLFVVST